MTKLIKRYHNRKQDFSRSFRINERISAITVRVLDNENKQVGVMPKSEALDKARELELDLVEIAPAANPPVVKIVDFNKFLYQLEKKKQEEKRKTKTTEIKQVQLGPFMGENDLDTMARRARNFIGEGDKVKFIVKFRGPQMRHPEFGYKTLNKIFERIKDISKIEREPKMEGKQLSMIVSPDKKGKHAKEEDQQSSEQKI